MPVAATWTVKERGAPCTGNVAEPFASVVRDAVSAPPEARKTRRTRAPCTGDPEGETTSTRKSASLAASSGESGRSMTGVPVAGGTGVRPGGGPEGAGGPGVGDELSATGAAAVP